MDGRAGPKMEEGLARLKMISEGFDHGDLIGGASGLEEADDEDHEPADHRTSANQLGGELPPQLAGILRDDPAEDEELVLVAYFGVFAPEGDPDSLDRICRNVLFDVPIARIVDREHAEELSSHVWKLALDMEFPRRTALLTGLHSCLDHGPVTIGTDDHGYVASCTEAVAPVGVPEGRVRVATYYTAESVRRAGHDCQGQWKTLQPKSSKPNRTKTAEPGSQ